MGLYSLPSRLLYSFLVTQGEDPGNKARVCTQSGVVGSQQSRVQYHESRVESWYRVYSRLMVESSRVVC